jgi:hypothetical protein
MACPYNSRWGVSLREAVGVQGKGQGPTSEDGSAGRRHFVIAYLRGVVWLGPVSQFRCLRLPCSHFSVLVQSGVEAALRRHLAS